MRKMETLLLNDNLIAESMPFTIEMAFLITVNLQNNQLQVFDQADFILMPVLNTLQLNNNEITRVVFYDYDFLSLTTLELDNNAMMDLVMSDYGKMPQLSTLTLRNNVISDITPDVNSLLALTLLDLQDNQLATITMAVFDHLLLLETLNLKYNQLHVIDNYCHDRFDTFGAGFGLYLDGNPLHCDFNLLWIKECVFNMYVMDQTSPVCAGTCHTDSNFNDLSINDINGCTGNKST